MTSQTGTIIITGGTVGLGYGAALSLAKSRPDYLIILASRTDPKDAATTINALTGHKNVSFQSLDLFDLSNVRAFAASYLAHQHLPLRALLLNAGLQVNAGLQHSAEGYEKTFAINHLGHAMLFHLLYPALASDARVVVTSSGTHDPEQKTAMPPPVFDSAEAVAHAGNKEGAKYDGRERYSTSKLCNVLWTYALERRLAKLGGKGSTGRITVNAFDPGLMPGTGLARDAPRIIRFIFEKIAPHLVWLLKWVLKTDNIHTPEASGDALANLAIGSKDEGVSGKYYEGLKQINSSVDSMVVDKQEELWTWTIDAIGRDTEEKSRFELVK